MSFYLKYRPRLVSELDLDRVRESIGLILKSGSLAHAYLFVGPRGAGKTSTARIMAKAVNCLAHEGLSEPCLSCEMCQSIESGSAIDLIEIDAASHRGIDAMRDLRDKIGLAPVMGRKKVYIIDEVHMLTTEAFNALLKTLEEPPGHAVFILCTTEDYKVPETVLSRCVKVQFVKANHEEVKRSLMKAVTGEGMKIAADALELLASSVDGSFREGHKLLQQLSVNKDEISLDHVRSTLGMSKGIDPERLAVLLLQGKTKETLEEIAKAEELGVVWEPYAKAAVEVLRMELRAAAGLGDRKTDVLLPRIKLVVEKTMSAVREMKYAVIEQLPLEVLAVEVGQNTEPVVVHKPAVVAAKPTMEKEVLEVKKKPEKQELDEKEVVEEDEALDQVIANVSMDAVFGQWNQIVDSLKPLNHSVAGLLRSAKPKAIEGGTLVLEVFYKFHKDQLEQETKRRMVEGVIKQRLGLGKVRCVLGEKVEKVLGQLAEHDNIAAVGEDDKLVEMAEEMFV